jgi:hypothetical protein
MTDVIQKLTYNLTHNRLTHSTFLPFSNSMNKIGRKNKSRKKHNRMSNQKCGIKTRREKRCTGLYSKNQQCNSTLFVLSLHTNAVMFAKLFRCKTFLETKIPAMFVPPKLSGLQATQTCCLFGRMVNISPNSMYHTV